MLSLRKPTALVIAEFLDIQSKLDFTYAALGATAGQPPREFDVDHTRVRLGSGEQVYMAARRALELWEHFRLGWVEARPADVPLVVGQPVAVMARAMGLWWLNACRIVYTVDERERARRFGFAYGTLPDHVESGEERFVVEWDGADDSVWYDIVAFSRPHHVLTRLGYPLVRRTQKRFARDSAAAMQRAVNYRWHESPAQ
jgi:uncharacterized protein (UPF0548 family)